MALNSNIFVLEPVNSFDQMPFVMPPVTDIANSS